MPVTLKAASGAWISIMFNHAGLSLRSQNVDTGQQVNRPVSSAESLRYQHALLNRLQRDNHLGLHTRPATFLPVNMVGYT